MRTGSLSPGAAVRCAVGPFLVAMIGLADIGVSLSAETISRAQQRSILPVPKTRAAFQLRGPVQLFTINEVLANAGTGGSARVIDLSFDYNEPFGLTTFVYPEGLLWTKWRRIESDTALEDPVLQTCIGEAQQCTPAAARFGAIITIARQKTGRARLELVNQQVNSAIRYMRDDAQWGVPDLWSTPLTTFETGFGDCEDYAIAKYVALRESGVSAGDLRMVLGYDNGRMNGHAVLAVRDEGSWLFLDHATARPLAAVDMGSFVPLFSFDTRGVRLLVTPYIGRPMARLEPAGDALARLRKVDLAIGQPLSAR